MEFLRGVLRISNYAFYMQMSALEKQHAVVCGEAFPNDSIVRIHDAMPLPLSNDPVIDELPCVEEFDGVTEQRNDCADECEIAEVLEGSNEWDELICFLNDSPNFKTTHYIIAELSQNNEWSLLQINELCNAVINNNQVGCLIGDEDVKDFYMKLLHDCENKQDEPMKTVYNMLFEYD